MMPFGERGGKEIRSVSYKTSRLRGKIFHWFFMTFNVDKTALRNSLWSQGTGSAWGQRGRTLQQGNLLGLNTSKSKINQSPFLLGGREETAQPGNAGGCIHKRVLGNISSDLSMMANQTKLQQKGSSCMDPAALFRQQQIRGKKIGTTEVTGAGTWWGLAACSAFPQGDFLRHLHDWGSMGNSQLNIPGWIWDSLGLFNLICQPRTARIWCFLPRVERHGHGKLWGWCWPRGNQAGCRKTFPTCFQHRDGW